jgi:hypothetical protein
MTLRLGSELTAELNHIGHPSGSSHLVYLFDPAAPCSYWSHVSPAPAVPFAIPLLLAISRASSGFVPVCPGSVIFSVISRLTAVSARALFPWQESEALYLYILLMSQSPVSCVDDL